MPRSKPKYDARAYYVIGAFTISREGQTAIRLLYPQKNLSAEFFQKIEDIAAHYISLRKFRDESAREGNTLAALDSINGHIAELARIDGVTQRIIDMTACRARLGIGFMRQINMSLHEFAAVVRATKRDLAPSPRTGRPPDPKQDLARSLYEIFAKHELDPKATEGGSFEQALTIILSEMHESTGDKNIHKLTVAASKRRRLLNSPKNVPLSN